jgi:hypothetical protein
MELSRRRHSRAEGMDLARTTFRTAPAYRSLFSSLYREQDPRNRERSPQGEARFEGTNAPPLRDDRYFGKRRPRLLSRRREDPAARLLP